jgi:hypothetical protein
MGEIDNCRGQMNCAGTGHDNLKKIVSTRFGQEAERDDVSRFSVYASRFEGVRGNVFGLPAWARVLVLIAAIPGIVLLALSVVLFLVSLSALFLLAAPVYGMLRRLTVRETGNFSGEVPERRHAAARVIEDAERQADGHG